MNLIWMYNEENIKGKIVSEKDKSELLENGWKESPESFCKDKKNEILHKGDCISILNNFIKDSSLLSIEELKILAKLHYKIKLKENLNKNEIIKKINIAMAKENKLKNDKSNG